MNRLPEPPSIDELRRRHTITVKEYARLMGVSKDAVYEAAARDQLRVLRIGKRILVPTAPLLVELGYQVDES